MTQESAVFNISEFELRNYTSPYLSSDQAVAVDLTESRVQSQLDFLAQMLGWNGPNYWGNLTSTVDQKRQLLGGTFGVYNSYVIPTIYEIRNWDNKIVVDRLQFIEPGRQTQVARVLLGDNVYTLQSVEVEGDKYVISIGDLSDEFFALIAEGNSLKVDIPNYRPAPFRRPSIGISGDYSFVCGSTGSNLILYPTYDTKKQFPFKFPLLFTGATYYFNQPIYLALDSTLTPEITPEYDSEKQLWVLAIPDSLTSSVGITGYLAWANSNVVASSNLSLEVFLQPWSDPSDWGAINVLDNFTGVWGNKGGDLPFDFVFDALSIHGFNESESVSLPPVQRELSFNDIVNFVYYQKTSISELAPPGANPGDLWWNNTTGALAVWLPNEGCGNWVEIDYRKDPAQNPDPQVVFPNVPSFRAGSSSVSPEVVVRIEDITGLDVIDNVIGIQGILTSPGQLVLHRLGTSQYWTPDEFVYANTTDFQNDASLLPQKVPVTLTDATNLAPQGVTYEITNLPITISGDYEVVVIKYYTNTTWEIFPDSLLKYIAFSSLFGSPLQGEMWWDFANADPNTRASAIYYETAWVAVNSHSQSGPPAPVLDLGSVLFYCDGVFLQDGIDHITEDYIFSYTSNPVTGKYTTSYVPKSFSGRAQLPTITISDSLTTTYRADITELVFSGITYYMSPNVYNAETPLRLWKSQALQVAETVEHLVEGNYINPLLADLNTGPGPENWEKYFVRLPLEYGRNGDIWQKVALICQDFAYWGSSIEPEKMRCPPEDDLPAIYEELFLYNQSIPDYTYVYSEPYLYSNVAFFNSIESGAYQNSGVYPASDVQFDEFSEAEFFTYDPLHSRQADVTSPINAGYGDWIGEYVNINPCIQLTGYLTTDLVNGGVTPIAAPVWDASIYKFAPTCQNLPESYMVDANHYKVSYSYFVADASVAEDPFFDISQEAAWRYPVTQPRTSYLVPPR